MLIGYGRVSTADQSLGLQRDALQQAGCEKCFEDVASGAAERPGLFQALGHLREGDTLVVWKLDRLGRSLKHLIEVITDLQGRGVGFRSLSENLDTTTPGGKLVFHVFGAMAEFERELIRERTKAGLNAARARGRKGGRKPKWDRQKQAKAKELLANESLSIGEICTLLGVSRATFYRKMEK